MEFETTLDALDDLCKSWIQARRCTSLVNGDCDGIDDNSHTVTVNGDGSLTCDPVSNTNDCSQATCTVDTYFVTAIKDLIDNGAAVEASGCDLPGVDFVATPPTVAKSCVGTAPDLTISTNVNADGLNRLVDLINADASSTFVAQDFQGTVPASNDMGDLMGARWDTSGAIPFVSGNRKRRDTGFCQKN